VSLKYTETLRGSWFRVETPDDVRLCEVAVGVTLHRPKRISRKVPAELTGTATFEGLATAVPIQGDLLFQVSRPRRIHYTFALTTDDGRTLQFRGDKNASLMRPIYSATTLFGSLFDGDKAVAMVRLQFDLRRDLVAFLQSVAREHDDNRP
jgi:hypothetical protein